MRFQDAITEAVIASRTVVEDYIHKHPSCSPPIHLTEAQTSSWLPNQTKSQGIIDCAKHILRKDLDVAVYNDDYPSEWETPVPSFLLNYESKAIIFVANENRLNFCHSRFFVAKEIIHALLQQILPETVTVEPDSVIDLLSDLINRTTPFDDSSPDPQLIEEAAFYGAIELLLPKELFERDVLPLYGQGWSHKKLAEHYKIPLRVVEFRLNKAALFNGFYNNNDGQDLSRLKFIVGSAQKS